MQQTGSAVINAKAHTVNIEVILGTDVTTLASAIGQRSHQEAVQSKILLTP